MVLVQTSNTVSSTISLSCAIISFFACSAVVLSIYFYQQKKNSYHLQLVGRLLFSDLFLSCCIIFYYVIQYALNTSQLRQFCKLYLPLVLFSFLSSFAWTIMLALRFHTTQNIDSGKAYKPSKNLNHIWIGPAVLAALILIVSAITGDVTTVHTNDTDTNQACTFNHDTTLGVAMDLICFQIPMIFTILINIYYYSKGIFGIRNAPHSVIGRQMRRAGGYLGVLLLVTLPNLIYNMVTIFTGSENSYSSFLDLAVFLSSLQGFFNVCVYIWVNNSMRKWFLKHFVFFRFLFATNESSGRRYNGDNSFGVNDSEKGLSQPFSKTDIYMDKADLIVENPMSNSLEGKLKRSKSILVPKNEDAGTKTIAVVSGSVDLDSERFVRFGEISTRYISYSTPRASEHTPEETGKNDASL